MVLEASVLLIDNSEWTRNGDYTPSRFQVRADLCVFWKFGWCRAFQRDRGLSRPSRRIAAGSSGCRQPPRRGEDAEQP